MRRLPLLLVLLPTLAVAASLEPHPHRGIFPPVTADPGPVALTPEQAARLEDGKLVQQMKESDEGGWGTSVQLVRAPPETIWDTILAYDRYEDRVPNVKSCEVYKREGDTLYVAMQSGIPGVTFTIYSRNVVRRAEGWMAWTLDYDRTSDVHDMVGHWRVTEVSKSPPVSRLDYSTRMQVKGAPGFVVRSLTKSSLESGTAWVKEHAEAAAAR